MSDKPLEGRIGVVTGASAGIGEAIARDLAAQGAAGVVNARRAERLERLVNDIDQAGGRATAVAGDASDSKTIDAMLDAARDRFGSDADLVVVNAGRGLAGSAITSDESQWEEVVKTNLLGAARLIRAAGKRMLELAPADKPTSMARDIIVLGSTVGRHISPFSSMYGSTKFGVNSLAEASRRELGPRGIRVSLIEPAVVASEFQSVAGYSDELVGNFKEKFGPLLEPEDIARLTTFIVSQPAHVHVNDVVIRSVRQDYP
ncbi:MAG: SDR family oxidoreductase [Planctomycetota bacterium]|nr:SDR family oxidoreductase [Planctomycetota bacterium]